MSQMDGIKGSSIRVQPGDGFKKRRKKEIAKSKKGNLKIEQPEEILQGHHDSENFRYLTYGLMKKKENGKPTEDDYVHFSRDAETGDIHVVIVDALHGRKELKLTTEQVEQGLKKLEETEDPAIPFSSFFISHVKLRI